MWTVNFYYYLVCFIILGSFTEREGKMIPSEWNGLPVNIRHISDIRQFKRALETRYFTEAYS